MTSGPRRAGWVGPAVHATTMLAGFAVLLFANRAQWFFGDEWDFLADRGVPHGDYSIWAPHNEHWSTAPILIYRALYAVFGVRTYLPYVLVLLMLHLAVTHLLWQVMRSTGADVMVATALAAIYVVLGAGHENLLWAFQIGFIGSVALGLAAVLLVNHDDGWGRRDFAAWGVSVLGLMFSGVSTTMVAVTALVVLLRRGWRHAILTAGLPGAVYLAWFFLAGRNSLTSERGAFNGIEAYPEYIWSGVRSGFENVSGWRGAGVILILGFAAFLLVQRRRARGPAAPAFAGAIGLLVMFSLIAVARAGLGPQQAEASRYAYIVAALALPAVGLALQLLVDGRYANARRVAVLVPLLLVGWHNVAVLRDSARQSSGIEQTTKARILAAADLVSSATILGGVPDPELSPDLDVGDLRAMIRDGKLPSSRAYGPGDRLYVADNLQYAVNRSPLPGAQPPQVDGVVGANERAGGPGCRRLFPTAPEAELHVKGGRTMSLRVTTQVDGVVRGFLRLFKPALTGRPHQDMVKAGVPVYVNVTADIDQVVIRVPAVGTTEICGVT